MPRICIDGFNLAMPGGAGIATYARNLLPALTGLGFETQVLMSAVEAPRADPARNLGALLRDPPPGRLAQAARLAHRLIPRGRVNALELLASSAAVRASKGRLPCADRLWAAHDVFHAANAAFRLWRRFTEVRLGAGAGADLMHWTCPLPLSTPRMPNVYTLHDVIPLRLPHLTLDNKRAYLAMARGIAARADRIITVSEAARRDIVDLLDVDEARVVNTHQAVEMPDRWRARGRDDVAAELEGFGLTPDSYYLFFGAAEPKKNLRRLAEAFASAGVTAPLVIAGPAWLNAAQARRFGAALAQSAAPPPTLLQDGRIRLLGYQPVETLRALIVGARATLFPSLAEGFGLPVLESMLLGTPVLASTAGALPEVAGEAAILVDPDDADAIRGGIRRLDADTGLRVALSEAGRAQAAKFSPERYRERLAAAYAPLL